MVVFLLRLFLFWGSDMTFVDLPLKEKDVGLLFKALRAAAFKRNSLQFFTLDSIGLDRKCGSG